MGHTRTKESAHRDDGFVVLAACSSSQSARPSETPIAAPDPAQTAEIEAVARESMDKHNLRALIVNVTRTAKTFTPAPRGRP